jgi:hypothetical protein
VDLISKVISLLPDHGVWALVVIQGVVIWQLAKYIQRMQTKHQDTVKQLLLDYNKEQREETRQLVAAMLSTEKALQSMHDIIQVVVVPRRE